MYSSSCCQDYGYPTFLTTQPRRRSLLYPDNMYVKSHSYFKDLRLQRNCNYLTIWTSCQGLDLLFHLLTHMGKGPQGTRNVRSWIHSIYRHRSHYRYIQGHFLFQDHPEDLIFNHPHIRPPTAIIRKSDDENSFTDVPFWGPYETEWLRDQDYAGLSYDQLRIF